MPRNLPSLENGLETVTKVTVSWPGGATTYADRDVPGCVAGLINVSAISTSIRDEAASELGSVTVELSDTDNSIKSIISSSHIAGIQCDIVQDIAGSGVLVLTGRLGSDFRWEEGERKAVFTIDTAFVNAELGFAPTRDDIPTLARAAEGKMWPIVFGSCLKVPALRIIEHIQGKLAGPLDHTTATVLIENGEEFTQGAVTLRFKNGLVVGGTMTDNTLSITEYNKADATGIVIAARPGGDDDYSNPYVLWVTLPAKMTNKYCISNGVVNYCTRQEGTKCWFSKPWKVVGENPLLLLPTGSYTTIETSSFVRAEWNKSYQAEQKQGTSWVITRTVKANTTKFYPGEECYEDTGTPTYIVNDGPTTIKGVYAYRSIDNIRSLQPIPSSYYTKTENGTLGGRNCAYLTFETQIENREGENWESGVYVTQTSGIECNNNTAEILRWLLEKTNITIDATSFADVSSKVSGYPSNFVIQDSDDILSICADIAYQARIALSISTTAKLRYLSEDTTSLASIYNEGQILHNTFTLGLTDPNNVITSYNAKWRPNYATDPLLKTYKRNIDKYGERRGEREYWIYNIESLVDVSASFWFNRLCDMWFTANFTTTIAGLKEEAFDCTGIALHSIAETTIGSIRVAKTIRGLMLGSSFDSDTDTVQLNLQLASRLGGLQEDLTFFTGSPAVEPPLVEDPTNGITEIDYVVYTGDTNNSPNGVYYQQEPEPELVITVTNPAPKRDDYFTMTVNGGVPNATYTVSLVKADSNEQLHTSGGQLTSIVLDANGAYSNSVRFRNGTSSLDPVKIVLTRLLDSDNTAQSEQIFVVGVSSTATGKDAAFRGQIGSKVGGNTYNVTLYPAAGGTWNTTALQLQGDSSKTIPSGTWAIFVGSLIGTNDGTSPTHYNFYMQVPIWL